MMPLNAPLNRTLRMGLVGGGGTGFIGKVHRIAATLDGRARLVAGAFSSDPLRCGEAAADFGVPMDRAYASFTDFLKGEQRATPDNRLDFISIATPNWLHFPMASAALESGFHVVCDKPMTITSADAEQLVRHVEQTAAVFAVCHNYTGYPLVRQARQMIADGELGPIRAVRVNYIQGWIRGLQPGVTPARGLWKSDPAKAGPSGAMADIGSHAFNLACYLTGLTAQSVSARLWTTVAGRPLEDYGHALVQFETGAVAMITVSQATHGRLNDLSVEVDGEKASLTWRQEDPNTLIVRSFGQPARVYDRHPAAPYMNDSGRNACRLPAGHPEAFFEAFANLYAAVFDDIVAQASGQVRDSRRTVYPNVYDGRNGVRFIAACLKSSQADGAWQPLQLQY